MLSRVVGAAIDLLRFSPCRMICRQSNCAFPHISFDPIQFLGTKLVLTRQNGGTRHCGEGLHSRPHQAKIVSRCYTRPTNRRGETMKGARLVCPALLALVALTCSGRNLRAG